MKRQQNRKAAGKLTFEEIDQMQVGQHEFCAGNHAITFSGVGITRRRLGGSRSVMFVLVHGEMKRLLQSF